jgi:hypothetical protein
MATIVAGFGVPHTPVFPFFVKRDGPDCETAKLFAAQKQELAAARPDVIVMFDTDHLNTFFLDNLPIFAVGVDKAFTGPNDEPREMPVYKIPSAVDLAGHIRKASIEAGFDAALTQQFSRAAAPIGAALLRARAGGRPRDRCLAATAARRRDGQRQFFARGRRPAHGAGPHRWRAGC